MNEAQKIYCDGAAMAYRDAAKKLRQMIKDAPFIIKNRLEAMEPFAEALDAKAIEVYKECERFTGERQ